MILDISQLLRSFVHALVCSAVVGASGARADTLPVFESATPVSDVWSVFHSAYDNLLYFTRRDGSQGSVWRFEKDGSITRLDTNGRAPGGLFVDPADGDIFYTEDYRGYINRITNDGSSVATWVTGFGGGDDDPTGILIVPDYYTGSVANPGDAFVTDRGYGNQERFFSFSKDSPQGEQQLLFFSRADGLFGVVATDTEILLVEYGRGLQRLVRTGDAYSLESINTDPVDISDIHAAAWDNARKLLYLAIRSGGSSSGPSRVAAYDPETGSVTTIIEDLISLGWSSISVSSDYERLYLADSATEQILVYRLPGPLESTISDASFAWAANTGWINLKPSVGDGVMVHETHLSGYAYDSNTGWINFGARSPVSGDFFTNTVGDHGVNHSGGGLLYGYAWSSNLGWINFGWASANDPNAPRFDLISGDFSGYAWSPNAGWVNLGTGQLRTDSIKRLDNDLDGIDDNWERRYFGDIRISGINTDRDSDGVSDAAEYVGGTHPLDAESYFRVLSTDYGNEGTEVAVEFTSSANRLYQIKYTHDLTADPSWIDSGLGTIYGEPKNTTARFILPENDQVFLRVFARRPLSN